MKRVIVLILMLLGCNWAMSETTTKLSFKKIDGKYVVIKPLNEEQLVNGNNYVSAQEVICVLNHFDLSNPQEKLGQAYLHPGQNIFVRSDSAYSYEWENYYLKVSKLKAKREISYEPKYRAIFNQNDTEKTEGILAWHMIIYYVALTLIIIFFSLLINLILKRWIFFSLIASGLLYLCSFLPCLLVSRTEDSALMFLVFNLMFMLFPGILTLLGFVFGCDPLETNYRDPGNKQGNRLARGMFSFSIFLFLAAAAFSFGLITGMASTAWLLFALTIGLTIGLSLIIFIVKKLVKR